MGLQHFRVLDFWRLFAAVGVMSFHFLRYAPVEHRWMEESLHRLLPVMDMFFMISGFLIMLHHGDSVLEGAGSVRRFIVRRFARIYPLYFATLLFFIGIGIAVQLGYVTTGWAHRFDFEYLPHNLLLIQSWGLVEYLTFNYVAWTLSAEWFCYLVFPLLVAAFKFSGAIGLAVIAAVAIVSLEAISAAGLIPEGSWLKTNSWAAFRAFADFTVGALIAVLVRRSRWMLRSHLPAWTLFFVSLATMYFGATGHLSLALLASAVFLAALAEQNNPDGANFLKPLHGLGQVSFGIYLIHPVLEVGLFSVIWRMVLEPQDVMPFFVYWLFPMGTVLLVALASNRWFERRVGQALVGWHEGVLTQRKQSLSAAE